MFRDDPETLDRLVSEAGAYWVFEPHISSDGWAHLYPEPENPEYSGQRTEADWWAKHMRAAGY